MVCGPERDSYFASIETEWEKWIDEIKIRLSLLELMVLCGRGENVFEKVVPL